MARTPIPFVCKFLCLHNYGIKYSTWDRYLHIIFAVIPPSWFIILLYIFFRLYSNKADFNTHALFIHSFIHSPSIYVSNSDFFLESQTRIHCCSRHFSTCMSRKHCSRAEAAAHCWPSAHGDVAPLLSRPPDLGWPVTTLTTRHEEIMLFMRVLCPFETQLLRGLAASAVAS